MTETEFKLHLKEGHGFADKLNYATCLAVAGFGIYWVFEFEFAEMSFFGIAIVLISAYAYIKISSDYKVSKITSDAPIEIKLKCIREYADKLNILTERNDDKLHTYIFKNKYWNRIKITFYIDERSVLYNATLLDMNSEAKGILDFGVSARVNKKIENLLQHYLRKHAGSCYNEDDYL